MEVGEQPAHDAKSKPRVDEQVRVSGSLAYASTVRASNGLERSRRRRADRNDAALRVERSRDRTGRDAADLVGLRIDAMALHFLAPDRLERPVAHMQRDGGTLDCACIEPRH